MYQYSDQFTQDGDAFTFRFRGVGKPLSVKKAERDASVAKYERTGGRLILIFFVLYSASAIIFLFSLAKLKPLDLMTGFFGAVLVFMVFAAIGRATIWYLWQEPERLFGVPNDSDLAASRRLALDCEAAQTPWWTIAVWLALAPFQIAVQTHAGEHDLQFALMAAVMTMVFCWNMALCVRKLRLKTPEPQPTPH